MVFEKIVSFHNLSLKPSIFIYLFFVDVYFIFFTCFLIICSVDAIKNFEVEVGMNMIEVDGRAMAPRQLKLGSLDGKK